MYMNGILNIKIKNHWCEFTTPPNPLPTLKNYDNDEYKKKIIGMDLTLITFKFTITFTITITITFTFTSKRKWS